jgi:exodeoxyribonuclease VII large subunit
VEGEVSNFYCHNNKHCYFDLKDEYSKIKVVMFSEAGRKLDFRIEDGLHLILSGYVSVYEKRGEYQIIALSAEPAGKGALLLAFEQLKAKLDQKGYFDAAHKKPLPVIPERIGAVTSSGGAVIKDIITVLTSRYENFHLIVRNVNVQGPTSKEEICAAIDDLCEYGADVIIIARGGGSLEDLWAFNTETVAEKIYHCPVPVISAVGHETDYTICDFVSDVRAATPSVAAGMVIADKKEIVRNIGLLLKNAKKSVDDRIFLLKKELNFLASSRIFKNPEILLAARRQDFDFLQRRLNERANEIFKSRKQLFERTSDVFSMNRVSDRITLKRIMTSNLYARTGTAIKARCADLKNSVKTAIAALQSNSPVSVLEKGFCLTMDIDEKKIIRSVKSAQTGDKIKVFLKDGALLSEVLEIISKKIGYKE